MKLYLLFFLIGLIDSYKVLVCNPLLYHSHMQFLNSIADTLAEAGHDVTVFMPVCRKSMNSTAKFYHVKKIIYYEQYENVTAGYDKMFGTANTSGIMKVWGLSMSPFALMSAFKEVMQLASLPCKKMFNDKELIEKFRNENFDLGIGEPMSICPFALFNYLGIEAIISASALGQTPFLSEAIGEPLSASHVPGLLSESSEDMNIFQRANNAILSTLYKIGMGYMFGLELDSIEDIVGQRHWREYLSNISFSFVNWHTFLEFPRPSLPKTVFIGGITLKQKTNANTTLSEEWNEILNRREQNILISFGTFSKAFEMPLEYKKSLIELFKFMPNTTFIFKYEHPEDELFKDIENVVLTTWMPQVQLLADPRLDLFITHGGLGSTIELAHSGKPAIVIPVQGDQHRNSEMLVRHKMAVRLPKHNLESVHHLIQAIEKVMNDANYRENAKRLADLMSSQITSPKELVIKHSELAVKFGMLRELDSYGKNFSTFKYYLYDVVLLFIFLFSLTISLFAICIRFIYRKCRLCCKKKESQNANDQTESLLQKDN